MPPWDLEEQPIYWLRRVLAAQRIEQRVQGFHERAASARRHSQAARENPNFWRKPG